MLRVFVTAYPWDLMDEGVAPALDRLHGEVGVSGVSVRVATAPVMQLRARDLGPRVFRTRGGVFFHPDEERYAGTRCKPIVSSWLKRRDPLKRIADACEGRGMELRVMISAARTGRLAQRHAEMACRNAFGDDSHVSLCLANADVQAYLCGLVADLSANYTLSGVTLSDFRLGWAEALATDLCAAHRLGEAQSALLFTCFCESCHQRATAAGVDVPMARRSVQTILQTSFDNGVAADLNIDTLLADDTPLAAYYRWRTREMCSLLGRLAELCTCELLLDRALHEPGSRYHSGLDLSIPAAVLTRIDRPDQLASALCPTARRSELRLPGSLTVGAQAPELVSTLAKAAELGLAGVEIDNYGLLPEPALTALKQAIRFARRSTPG